LAEDAEARSRFQREAKAIAALSHPNILALYDFDSDQGVAFAVMELLEGETLESRLTLGPMDWHKALEIAIAVSHGLAAAHAKGITHRDIKPANIFLTAANVKILDFGIALICAPSPPQPEPGNTIPSAVTRPGFAVGTVGYMAPERLRGGAVGPS